MALASRTTARASSAFGAAGWLLAEVALILMVISQGLVPPPKPASEQPPPTTVEQPDDGNDPDEDKGPCVPPGINTEPERIEGGLVLSGPSDRETATELIRRIKARSDRRAGVILIFGVTYNASDASAGTDVSEDLVDLLKQTRFYEKQTPAMRAFLQIYGPQYQPGEVLVDVYYFRRSTCT